MKDLRFVLHSAYTFVRSIEANKAAAPITLDHVIDEQIKRLKKGETTAFVDSRGSSAGTKASRWDRLETLEKELKQAVDAIKNAGDDPEKLIALGLMEEEAK